MTIRAYLESDRETLKAITVEAFNGVSVDQNTERMFGLIGEHDWQWRKARQIDEDIDHAHGFVWVAENEVGRVIGYITTRVDRVAGIGFIPNLAVQAGLRGHGIGRQLIEFALQQFRAAGLGLARIETLDQNAVGSHLYPACGFIEVAQQIHYAMRL
jgi:ribosomal protein S18 acetylase RimI-like enzyme